MKLFLVVLLWQGLHEFVLLLVSSAGNSATEELRLQGRTALSSSPLSIFLSPVDI
jgi:hypothetical protein